LIDVLPFYSCSVRCNIIIRAISVAIKTIDQLRRNRFRKDPPDARLLFTGMRSRNFQTTAVSHPVHFEVISQEHWSRASEDQGFLATCASNRALQRTCLRNTDLGDGCDEESFSRQL